MDAVTRAVATGEDLYGLLGVAPGATDDDVRHAYRALARRHHPDAHPEGVEAAAVAERFRRIATAYEILGDERERAAYDRALRLERIATERAMRPGPVASHVAPRPTGAVGSRGRAASANPADHAPRVVRDAPARPRQPVDEWKVVSVLGRVVALAAAIVLVAVIALMVVSASAREAEPPPPTIWCKTPDGWHDCWQATSPDGA